MSEPSPLVAHLPKSPGVYLLTHAVTGDTYVGSAKNIRGRFGTHLNDLRNKCHANPGLLAVVTAHGLRLECRPLELTAPEDRVAAERRWVEELKPTLNRHAVPHSARPLKPEEPRRGVRVRIDLDIHRSLLHLAIDLDETVEKLAGRLLADAVARARAELEAKKRPAK